MTLPEYLRSDLDDRRVLARMLARVPDVLDRAEGSFVWDMLAPGAIELALVAQRAREVLDAGFAQTAGGVFLARRAEEHGVIRKAATRARVTLALVGSDGTLVPAGTEFATASTETRPAVRFRTVAPVTLVGGAGEVVAEATVPGAMGNVAAGTVVFRVTPVAGLTGVTNAAPATGGTDEETDAALLERYLVKVRNPSAGGNRADYVNWALAVPGVSAVAVVPVRDGPGTVAVAVLGPERAVPEQALVDTVQEAIAPPHRAGPFEAEGFALSGFGVSLDASLPDDVGSSVHFVYSGSGAGRATQEDFAGVLAAPGIWTARVRCKVDVATGTAALLRLGVWDRVLEDWAVTAPGGSEPAWVDLAGADLATGFSERVLRFFWDGVNGLDLVIERRTTDTVRQVWVDQVRYQSGFSRVDGDGLAPVGAQVSVEGPTVVPVDIEATLVLEAGYVAGVVTAAAEAALEAYLRGLAFAQDNDVRYSRVATTLLDVPGVADYTGLLVNGGTANVAIGPQELAVPGVLDLGV